MDHHSLNIVRKLVGYVSRAFYAPEYIMLIDILNQYQAYYIYNYRIKEEDLAHKLRLHIKEIQKMCGKLREDKFVLV